MMGWDDGMMGRWDDGLMACSLVARRGESALLACDELQGSTFCIGVICGGTSRGLESQEGSD